MKLYIIGFIELKSTRVLINPAYCTTISEIIDYLEVHELTDTISEKDIADKLGNAELIRIEVSGYKVALLIGNDSVIDECTDRFVSTGNKRFYPVHRKI